MLTEADTCRKYVLPKLVSGGWDEDPRSFTEQRTFTDGRILTTGGRARRGPQKRADYLLRYTPDFTIAVVEAKAAHKTPGTGLQQAKEYAEILNLKFAYSTNGHGIVEFDYVTGQEMQLDSFPTPNELWERLRAGQALDAEAAHRVLTPLHSLGGTRLRYYQELAVNRAVSAILNGQGRTLLTMATGTGKTIVAFQICWKLWNARWNLTGEYRRPKILYLADRNILVDDPKDKVFTPFGDARWKIAILLTSQVSFAARWFSIRCWRMSCCIVNQNPMKASASGTTGSCSQSQTSFPPNPLRVHALLRRVRSCEPRCRVRLRASFSASERVCVYPMPSLSS